MGIMRILNFMEIDVEHLQIYMPNNTHSVKTADFEKTWIHLVAKLIPNTYSQIV